jgi:hypothetical protein
MAPVSDEMCESRMNRIYDTLANIDTNVAKALLSIAAMSARQKAIREIEARQVKRSVLKARWVGLLIAGLGLVFAGAALALT